MKAYLCFVPKGGGENDYWLETDMPQAPSKGDWIRIVDKEKLEENGRQYMRDFTVGQVEWEFSKEGESVKFDAIRVECEFALSTSSCDEHRRVYEAYTEGTGETNELRDTMF